MEADNHVFGTRAGSSEAGLDDTPADLAAGDRSAGHALAALAEITLGADVAASAAIILVRRGRDAESVACDLAHGAFQDADAEVAFVPAGAIRPGVVVTAAAISYIPIGIHADTHAIGEVAGAILLRDGCRRDDDENQCGGQEYER